MAKDKKPKNDMHDGEQTDSSQAEQLMDEQYEFGLNEDVREEIENQEDDNHKEPENKADKDDVIIKDDED